VNIVYETNMINESCNFLRNFGLELRKKYFSWELKEYIFNIVDRLSMNELKFSINLIVTFSEGLVTKQFEKEEKDESACQSGCFPLEWTLWICRLKWWVTHFITSFNL
jgi:hypothetical protein